LVDSVIDLIDLGLNLNLNLNHFYFYYYKNNNKVIDMGKGGSKEKKKGGAKDEAPASKDTKASASTSTPNTTSSSASNTAKPATTAPSSSSAAAASGGGSSSAADDDDPWDAPCVFSKDKNAVGVEDFELLAVIGKGSFGKVVVVVVLFGAVVCSCHVGRYSPPIVMAVAIRWLLLDLAMLSMVALGDASAKEGRWQDLRHEGVAQGCHHCS
jgi:hypothetical protein